MELTRPTCTVYFDGGCPVCSREIAHYRSRAGAEAIAWVDAARDDEAALGPGLSRERALARMHVRRADGSLVSGAAAFAALWSGMPQYAWLGRVAAWPPVLAFLEVGYRGFLVARRAWRTEPAAPHAAPAGESIIADLRTDHAGEAGAVQIYRGILAVARDRALREFAARHLATERTHLAHIECWLPADERSRLLPLWRAAGWLTGALPALFGPRAVYATIEAVERFVDAHYAEQIDRLVADAALVELHDTLVWARGDEIAHRNEAAAAQAGAAGPVLRAWAWVVGAGSKLAVAVSRRV
jgi:demethoxyubiquinone hydroxylase (CLK1/Coq7/Cat5 family)